MNAEFDYYFQNIKNTGPNISVEKILQIKTELLPTREKYSSIKVPFKHRQMIKQLAENNSIMLLRQDKDKGLVIMDKEKYTKKHLNLLNPNQCNKLSDDLTKTVENKIKRT